MFCNRKRSTYFTTWENSHLNDKTNEYFHDQMCQFISLIFWYFCFYYEVVLCSGGGGCISYILMLFHSASSGNTNNSKQCVSFILYTKRSQKLLVEHLKLGFSVFRWILVNAETQKLTVTIEPSLTIRFSIVFNNDYNNLF